MWGRFRIPRLGMRAVANNPSARVVEGVWYVECGRVGGGWREMVCGQGVFTDYMARSAATYRTCGRFKFRPPNPRIRPLTFPEPL